MGIDSVQRAGVGIESAAMNIEEDAVGIHAGERA